MDVEPEVVSDEKKMEKAAPNLTRVWRQKKEGWREQMYGGEDCLAVRVFCRCRTRRFRRKMDGTYIWIV